jgi:tetratricopeptide (TPR) repeat protein
VPELRLRAARVLELVYEAKDEIRHLVRVLEIRREGGQRRAERRELLRRDRDAPRRAPARRSGGVLDARRAAAHGARGRERAERFVDIGRRLGEHEKVAPCSPAAADASDRRRAGEILMEVARICEDLLGDVARAGRGLPAHPARSTRTTPRSCIPAAQALGASTRPKGGTTQLAEVLGIEVRLEDPRGDAPRPLRAHRHALRDGAARSTARKPSSRGTPARRRRRRMARRSTPWSASTSARPLARAGRRCSTPASRTRPTRRAAPHDDEGRGDLAKKLGDVPEAINAWRAVLDELGPERPRSPRSRALRAGRALADLAETLEVDLSLADETADRLDLYARLGDVRRLHQHDLPGALDAYRQALLLDPTNARGRARPGGDARSARRPARRGRDAAAALRGRRRRGAAAARAGDPGRHDRRFGGEPARHLETAIRTAEGPLGDTGGAYGYALRGVRMAAGEPEIAKWIETLERFRLAEAKGSWTEGLTARSTSSVVDDILDGDVQQSCACASASSPARKLDDRALAMEHYKKALEAQERRSPRDDRAGRALRRGGRQPPNLLEILKTRVDRAGRRGEEGAALPHRGAVRRARSPTRPAPSRPTRRARRRPGSRARSRPSKALYTPGRALE